MTPRRTRQILIPVTIGESYQTGLVRRLQELGIQHQDIAREMGIHETQFSRWVARPSDDTGKPVSIGIENVIRIERAILALLERRKK